MIVKNKLTTMGVINITPNSFSDGQKYFDTFHCREQILKMIDLGVDIIDVGAESTAPFNSFVEQDEEWRRIEEIFLHAIDQNMFSKNILISLDTYKVSIIRKFIEAKIVPLERIIWNDVSGVIDPEMIELLQDYPSLTYIFSHTRVPKRELTQNHMKYADESTQIIFDVNEKFDRGLDLLHFHKNIILDPCFGFSKTLNQNYSLLKEFPHLIDKYTQQLILGISRKSFLKKLVVNSIDENVEIELLQYKIIKEIQNLSHKNFIVRLHNPSLLNLNEKCKFIFGPLETD
ncbi:MAG: dihydropteroate synthase [Halobacteriovoraceae bacterium]|nr:dihydropteroate synthase [Halobacteriovoraceae bacterium]